MCGYHIRYSIFAHADGCMGDRLMTGARFTTLSNYMMGKAKRSRLNGLKPRDGQRRLLLHAVFNNRVAHRHDT